MKKPSLYLLLYILVLQVLDVLTTYLAISHGAIELNPFIQKVVHDPVKFLAFKIIVGIVVYLLATDKDEPLKMKKVLLTLYTILMLQAIVNNILITLFL